MLNAQAPCWARAGSKRFHSKRVGHAFTRTRWMPSACHTGQDNVRELEKRVERAAISL